MARGFAEQRQGGKGGLWRRRSGPDQAEQAFACLQGHAGLDRLPVEGDLELEAGAAPMAAQLQGTGPREAAQPLERERQPARGDRAVLLVLLKADRQHGSASEQILGIEVLLAFISGQRGFGHLPQEIVEGFIRGEATVHRHRPGAGPKSPLELLESPAVHDDVDEKGRLA